MTLSGLPLLLSMIGLTLCGAGVTWLYMNGRLQLLHQQLFHQDELSQHLGEHLQTLSQQALQQNNAQFLQLAEQRFARLQEQGVSELGKKQQAIDALVKPLQESLKSVTTQVQDLEKNRATAYGDIRQLVGHMKDEQERLRKETTQLSRALRRPEVRGHWGEMQLLRTLELAGMERGQHFDVQTSTESERAEGMKMLRPDVIVHLPAGSKIIIDAKVPLDAYLNAAQTELTEEQRTTQLQRHAKQVTEHIRQLSRKAYWQDFDTVELVVMFLPDEGFLRVASEADPTLMERAMQSKVVPASPVTLFALLKAVMYGWRQNQVAEKAVEIAALGKELHTRVSNFTDHLAKVGSGLNTALNNYNKAVGSMETRVMPSLRKFESFDTMELANEVKSIPQIDASARDVS